MSGLIVSSFGTVSVGLERVCVRASALGAFVNQGVRDGRVYHPA
jgi:hypothetical protein